MSDEQKSDNGDNNDSGRRPWRRRNYMINPKFQLNFTLQAIMISLAVIASTRVIENYFMIDLIDQGLSFETNYKTIMAYVDELKNRYLYMFWVKSIIMAVAFLSWGVLMSHRIAGPLYKLKKTLIEYNSGEIDSFDLHFREKDHFQEIADELNKAVNKK